MSNVKDFRLGNFFLLDGEVYCVEGIDHYSHRVIAKKGDEYFVVNGEVPGIPITPEWLERFGFSQIETIQHNQYEVEERYTIRINETNISYGFVTETYGGVPDKRTRFKFSDETIDTHKGVHFMHQLQNLYFALTGEELTINNVNLQTTS